MKRADNLWEEIVSFENLHNAFYQVLKGKRAKPIAGNIFKNLEAELLNLQDELVSGSYIPGSYNSFWINEPKKRLISAAPIRDRIVHHALMNVLEPVFEKRFIYDSYACRKNKGTHKALEKFIKWSRNSKFVLKMDIKKFFPSIDHEILKNTIVRFVKDRKTINLIHLIIDCSNKQEEVVEYFEGDTIFTPIERKKGLLIGNLTSQWLGNLYLDPMDHFIKEKLKIRKFVRYVDDFVCFSDSKEQLKDALSEIAGFLVAYRLKMHSGKSRIMQLKEGIEFLGFIIRPDSIRLKPQNLKLLKKRMENQKNLLEKGIITQEKINNSILSWKAHAGICSTRITELVIKPAS